MKLEVYIPKGALHHFVDSITYLSGAGTGVAFQRMYQVIIINMGTNFHSSKVYMPSPEPWEQTSSIWINGKHEAPLMIENKGITAMYVIGVKHGMLPYLANLPAIETSNLAVSAEHWTSKEIFNLREQLEECDIHSGFLLIEDYFTKLVLKKDIHQLEKIQWLSKAINNNSVNEICHTLGATRKRLRSEAQHYFGGSVKNLQGIIRFNSTLAEIANNPNKSLSALHEYYDQAHFINDFKARCGITPLQYKRLCKLYPGIKYTPNFIPMQRETFLQFISSGDA